MPVHEPLSEIVCQQPRCPLCSAGRLAYAWHVGGRDVLECRGCGRRYTHELVGRKQDVCGLVLQEDLPDRACDHQWLTEREPICWPCLPAPALELAGTRYCETLCTKGACLPSSDST